MLGSATLTTVLSSIAIASAKHIVNRTMTFSRAFSPSKPNMQILLFSAAGRRNDAVSNPRIAGVVPLSGAFSGEPAVHADRHGHERDQESHDPDRRPREESLKAGGRDGVRRPIGGKGDVAKCQHPGAVRP